ncbi:hypothetical protein HPC49_10840 [Pyxidicoccus fallax]|uniref:Uncharacterized protein n=1 Tax=Pyxidicoccus fallax TaxID=394095 RepID=A0A848LEY8_9BACT|nr:hypothetical protein [Pyxidicoccus fallax]NMO15473.1 hypothetical protein [Pyxidicoccus fallax]NPC78738.1 hypothetical protein [Pyxidicoccus fallax]
MRVEIGLDVLRDKGAWHLLDRLVDCFLEERHAWHFEDEEVLLSSPWLTEEPESRTTHRNVEALQKYLTAIDREPPSHRRHRLFLVITRDPSVSGGIPPETARYVLEEKAYVIVENSGSDGAFLKAMMRAFGRDELAKALKRQWWEIDHAGGKGEIKRRLIELFQKGIPKDRILVFADSDRMFPGHRSETVELLEEISRDHQVGVIVLHKREIENYLPVSALQAARQKNTYRAFLALSVEQRDHYDMKSGFIRDKESERPIIPKEQEALFESLRKRGRHVIEALCGGFGEHAWRLFELKTHLPDENAMRLTCTTNPGEIEAILDRIEGLL